LNTIFKLNTMRNRYTIHLKLHDEEYLLKCRTHQEIVERVNKQLGYNMLSKTIIINWLSRGKKSAKYDFLTIS